MSEAVYKEIAARIGMHIIYVDLDRSDEGVLALVNLADVLEKTLAKADPNFDVAAWRRRTTPACVKVKHCVERARRTLDKKHGAA